MRTMRPGGFRRRAVASLIDSAFVFFFAEAIDLLIRYGFPVILTRNSAVIEIVSWTASFALQFVFYGYMLSRKGATPGKMVMRLRVLDDSNGAHLSFVRGGLRCALGYWISFIPLGIGYLMVAFRSDKKALHDLMFGSHVWYHEK